MWGLFLNDMRMSNIENYELVAVAETAEQLIAFVEQERVEPYRDDNWGKSFRQGGPLEWNNPSWGGPQGIHRIGTEDEWAERARRQYQEFLSGARCRL